MARDDIPQPLVTGEIGKPREGARGVAAVERKERVGGDGRIRTAE
jgi:hypothetical protein